MAHRLRLCLLFWVIVSRNAVMVAEETPTGRDDEPPVLKHKVSCSCQH